MQHPVPSDAPTEFLSPEEFWKLKKAPKTLRAHRCDPHRDAGTTLATTHATTPLRCVFFARGTCHRGPTCNYVHEVPDDAFFAYAKTQPQFDCFGRQRSGEDLTNCNDCTTLFIWLGGLLVNHKGGEKGEIEGMLRDDFAVFGPIAFINVILNKTIAFVRFKYRSSAEFAKEAMTRQRLTGDGSGTVLDVRWANEDPNPVAKARVKREREERFVQAVEGKEINANNEDDEDADDEDDDDEVEEEEDWRRYVTSSDEEVVDEEGEDCGGAGGRAGGAVATEKEGGAVKNAGLFAAYDSD